MGWNQRAPLQPGLGARSGLSSQSRLGEAAAWATVSARGLKPVLSTVSRDVGQLGP